MYAGLSNTRRPESSTTSPVHTSSATLPSSGLLGDLLIKKHAILTASAQNFFASPAFNLRHLALSAIVLFICSTTPFCCGVLRTVKCLLMPCCSQNSWNFESVYSVPLSDLRHLIFLPV